MSGTVDDMLSFVSKVYDVVLAFYNNDVEKANLGTMQWIRVARYGDWKFRALLSNPDTKLVDKVNGSAIARIDEFQDPTYSALVGVPHLFCSMNGVYQNKDTSQSSNTNPGDIAGWGGDWCKFYCDWWTATAHAPRKGAFAGDAWAFANLASNPSKYDFHIRDWIEDADAFNITTLLLQQNISIRLPTALQKYYKPTGKSGYKTRFQDFYNGRFEGKTESAVQTAFALLKDSNSAEVILFREGIILDKMALLNRLQPPSQDETRSLCKGFDTKFQSMIAAEKATP